MGVIPCSATPFSCDLSTDVNSCLMRCFLQISLSFPAFSSLTSSDRTISEMPCKRVSVSHCSSLSVASALLRRTYYLRARHPSLIIPEDHGILVTPFDLTAFLPLMSTKTLPSFFYERHSAALLTGVLMLFAVEHPTHGSSLLPFFSFAPSCSADLKQQAVVCVDSGAMSTSLVGKQPMGDNGGGLLCLSIKSSTVRKVQVSH